MKKFTVLFLAGLLVLAFGATAYAQAPKLEFRASGFIDVQTMWGVNVPQYNTNAGTYRVVPAQYGGGPFASSASGGWNKADTHWESRGHLKFDAIMGPNLSGTFYFEIDAQRFGSTWSRTSVIGREANNFAGWTTDRTAVEVKNIYIDVGLPYFGIPVPITVRAGAQPIGVRPAMLVYSDGAGVTAGIKIDPVLISPIYAKVLEGNDFADDDVDVWGLHVNAKLSTFTVGGYSLYYRMNTYPLFVNSNTVFAVTAAGVPTAFPAGLQPIIAGTDKAWMTWWGVYLDGKAGPVNLNFDFVYDYGKVEALANSSGLARDVHFQGWATRMKVDYPWEKFNFGAVGMYATGANTRATSSAGLPGDATSIGTQTRRNTSYVVPPGSEQGPGNGESMVVYSMEGAATGGYGIANNANYAALSRGGFGGTWFAKLYGSVKLAPWYKLTLQGLYIGDTTKHGNTFGNALKYPGVAAASSILRDDHRIGWEFDLIQEFQIYNNLRFFAGFGYLFAGDALDISELNAAGTAALGRNRTIANPWAFRTRLQYTF